MACAARSSGRTSLRPPPRLPIGVRTPPTMYASVMFALRLVDGAAKARDDGVVLVPNNNAEETEPVRVALLFGDGGQCVADRDRLRIRDRILDRHRHSSMRVARERERAVRQRVHDATVRYSKPIDHLRT